MTFHPFFSESLLKRSTVSVDPGRLRIIHALKFDRDGNFVKCITLTRKQYYTESKINCTKQKTSSWNKRVKGATDAISQNTLKTASCNVFNDGLNTLFVCNNDLLSEKLNTCWNRNEIYVRGRKESVLSKTLNNFQDPGEKIDVAYGNGKVVATAKNELSVPTRYVKDMCEAKFCVHEVDEYNTSSVCIVSNCRGQLFPVFMIKNGDIFQVRGLKWCNGTECAHCPLKHREDVGAWNIFEVFKDDEYNIPRPPLLDRSNPVQALRLPTKTIKNQHRLTAPHTNLPKSLKKKLKTRVKRAQRQRRYARSTGM